MTYPQNHDDNHENRLDRASIKSLASPDQIKIAVADLLLLDDVKAAAGVSMASMFGPSYAMGFESGVQVERERIRMNAGIKS